MRPLAGLLACAAAAAAAWALAPPPEPQRAPLAPFAGIGTLWLTQALPLAVTAQPVPLGAVLAGLATPRAAPAPFAHPVIFLFLGGFALAAALQLPVFLPVAAALGLPPPVLAAAVAIAASCVFILPVATPPNAFVFATEQVPQATMMRCGFWLNLVCHALLSALALWWWAPRP